MLNGAGKEISDLNHGSKDSLREVFEGKFVNNHFAGYGKKHISSVKDNENFNLNATYETDANSGGIGTIIYENGDRFIGTIGGFDYAIEGGCEFKNPEFSGKCISHSIPLSKSSGKVCLVPSSGNKNCLKEIGGWIDD